MEQKHNITDEQIARFLNGTASEEEKEVILEYMSQSDENLDELMSIADAVQAQRAAATPAHKTPPLVWRIAASVAVVLIAGGVWLALRDRGVNLAPQAGNTVAMNTSTTSSNMPNAIDESNSGAPVVNPIANNRPANSTNEYADAGLGRELSQQEQDLYHTQTENEIGNARIAYVRAAKGGDVNVNQQDIPQPDIEHVIRYNVPSEWTIGTDLLVTWEAKEGVRVEFRIINSKNTNAKDRNRWMTFQDTEGSIKIDADNLIRLVVGYEGDRHELIWELQPYFDNENQMHPVPPQRGRITVNYPE